MLNQLRFFFFHSHTLSLLIKNRMSSAEMTLDPRRAAPSQAWCSWWIDQSPHTINHKPSESSSLEPHFTLTPYHENSSTFMFVHEKPVFVTIVMSCVCTMSSTRAAVSGKGRRASPRANLTHTGAHRHTVILETPWAPLIPKMLFLLPNVTHTQTHKCLYLNWNNSFTVLLLPWYQLNLQC